VFTHFAVADQLARPETAAAIAVFDEVRAALPAIDAVHAANSAAAIAHPAARYTFVRIGIAAYGVSPGADLDDAAAALRPALSLKARVSFVKRLTAGESLSYGLRYTLPADAEIATVPIGYADGVRRNLTGRDMPVLIGGRRHPIVGTVTMDQILVDCGDADVSVGDEVVLIGEQGGDSIRAEDWAAALGTIGYEITCGISAHVPRRYLRGGEPVGP
jgi:alanine racemase